MVSKTQDIDTSFYEICNKLKLKIFHNKKVTIHIFKFKKLLNKINKS